MSSSEDRPKRRFEAVPAGAGADKRAEAATATASPAPISWSTVWAGLVITISVQAALTILGLTIGFGRTGPITLAAAGSALWSGLSMLAALFVGGFISGRLTSAAGGKGATGAWHGLILWGLVVTLSLALSATGIIGLAGFLGAAMLGPRVSALNSLIALAALVLSLAAAAAGGAIGERGAGR